LRQSHDPRDHGVLGGVQHGQCYPCESYREELAIIIRLWLRQSINCSKDRAREQVSGCARHPHGAICPGGCDFIEARPMMMEARLGYVQLLVGDRLEDQSRINAEYAILKIRGSNRRDFIAADA
jgi:hypothetical protein